MLTSSASRSLLVVLGAAIASLGIVVACSSDKDQEGADTPAPAPTNTGFGSSGDVPDAPAFTTPCVAKEGEAAPGSRPIDIIFAIDNSFSMTDEIAEVERQINENFIQILQSSNVDYRVVMLSGHGAHDGPGGEAIERICVRAPLSGTSCNPIPTEPAETDRFFHHDIIINSTDSWCKILTTFNAIDDKRRHEGGWSQFLRMNAFKVFAVITDDRVDTECKNGNGQSLRFNDGFTGNGETAALTFDSALIALSSQFGTPRRRNYIWHSIVAIPPFDPDDAGTAYPPDAATSAIICQGGEAPGTGYQALSRLTGGLRYPTCGLDFTPIFRAMAKDVIDKTILACDYALPKPDAGAIDPDTAVVRYTTNGVDTDFEQVKTADLCGPNKFYIENGRIKLCDDACNVVQADPQAEMKILFGCLPQGAK